MPHAPALGPSQSSSLPPRRRCVYELAYFTHYHGMHKTDAPSSKMLLLSLDWPSSFWPFKRTGLTEKEEEWITNFSCRDARCFKPSDRAAVLEAIRERFGSEEQFDEVRPSPQRPALLQLAHGSEPVASWRRAVCAHASAHGARALEARVRAPAVARGERVVRPRLRLVSATGRGRMRWSANDPQEERDVRNASRSSER